jgi:hypothetical protein
MTSWECSSEKLGEMALAALREAVARVMDDHRRRGKPVAIWKDGRVVLKIPEARSEIREPPAPYEAEHPGQDPNQGTPVRGD